MSPLDLSNLAKRQVQAPDLTTEGGGLIVTLWQAAKCHFDYPTPGVTQKFHKKQDIIPTLLGKIKGKSVEDTDKSPNITKQSKTSTFRRTSAKCPHATRSKPLPLLRPTQRRFSTCSPWEQTSIFRRP